MRLLSYMTKRPRFPTLLLAALIALPGISVAWDGTVSMVLGRLDVDSSDGGNYVFRVYASGAMCGNTNTWAYLNPTDTGYTTSVATLMMAKTAGLTVTIYSNQDSTGLCHIGYISGS
jgi:hypothetical protein